MSHLHLPDGVLPPWLFLGGYLLAGVVLALVWYVERSSMTPRRFALLGVFAAFMIITMSIEIPPLPYHANLSVVAGIVLGPPLAILAALLVNLFLAFLGHGGITVVGLNVLVMSVEILIGTLLFRMLRRVRVPLALAAFLAVVVGLGFGTAASYGTIAAGAPAINHWLRVETPEEHENELLGASAPAQRLNLKRLAVWMFGLGAIGWVLEGLLSSAVLVALNRVYPDLAMGGDDTGPVYH